MNSELFDIMCSAQLPIGSYGAAAPSEDKYQYNNNNSSSSSSTVTTSTTDSSKPVIKRRTNVPKCIDKTKILLPIDFEPSDYSIVCGNKRKYFNSPGNCRLRVIVKTFIPQYSQADGKLEKGYIVSKVMNMIRDACSVGAFVAFEKGRWWQVSERTSREKVGSFFRDCLSGKYASSAKNKIARRKTKREEVKKQPQVSSSSLPEQVASLPALQLTGLQALQMSHQFGGQCNFSALATTTTLPQQQQQQQQFINNNIPTFVMQQPQQQQQQIMLEQLQQQQFFIPQQTTTAATNFNIVDDGDSSISSGTSASFYDVDDFSPVPLLEL